MAWVDGSSRTTGTLITAAIWNQDVVDNAQFLHDRTVYLLIPPAGDGGLAHLLIDSNFYLARIRTEAGDYVTMTWRVPSDFDTLSALQVAYIPEVTNTMTFYVYVEYGADGEDIATHTGSDLTSSVSETADQVNTYDASGLVGSLAANDYLMLSVKGSGAGNNMDMSILGLYVAYTQT